MKSQIGEANWVVLWKFVLVVAATLLVVSLIFVQVRVNADDSTQTGAKQAESRIIIRI